MPIKVESDDGCAKGCRTEQAVKPSRLVFCERPNVRSLPLPKNRARPDSRNFDLGDKGAKSYIPSAGIAALYSSMGQQGQSCKWLQRAYEAHDSALAYIHVAPEWDALRSNPCFQDVVGRLGFPQDLGKK